MAIAVGRIEEAGEIIENLWTELEINNKLREELKEKLSEERENAGDKLDNQ